MSAAPAWSGGVAVTGVGVCPSVAVAPSASTDHAGQERGLWQQAALSLEAFGARGDAPAVLRPHESAGVDWMGGYRFARYATSESRVFVLAGSRAQEASRAAGEVPDDATGVVCGTSTAGLLDYARLHASWCPGDQSAYSPARGVQSSFNAPASHLAIHLGLRGPCLTVVGGRMVGFEAIVQAHAVLRSGRALRMLAGGVDAPCAGLERSPAASGTAAPAAPSAPPPLRDTPSEAAAVVAVEAWGDGVERALAVLSDVRVRHDVGSGGKAVEVVDLVAETLDGVDCKPSQLGGAFVSCPPRLWPSTRAALGSLLGEGLPLILTADSIGACPAAEGAYAVALATTALAGRAARRPPGRGSPPVLLALAVEPDAAAAAVLTSPAGIS